MIKLYVDGFSSSVRIEDGKFVGTEHIQVYEQDPAAHRRAVMWGALEKWTDKLHFAKTNKWFFKWHYRRCNNDCRWSGLGVRFYPETDTTSEERICTYEPPALYIELQARSWEHTKRRNLGDFEVSADEYNRIFFDGRKVV
jgi:hypothetical protein